MQDWQGLPISEGSNAKIMFVPGSQTEDLAIIYHVSFWNGIQTKSQMWNGKETKKQIHLLFGHRNKAN